MPSAVPPHGRPAALPRLVALDLDGTLLTDDKRVTPRTRRALGRLSDRGVVVVLCTGRPPRSALGLARDLGLTHPFICYNGAVVVDPASAAMSVYHVLDEGVARDALGRLRAAHPEVLVGLETARGWFLDPALHDLRVSEARLGPEPPDGVGPVEAFLRHGPIKLFARHAALGAEALSRPLDGLAVGRTWSNPHLLEVQHPDANKRRAVARMCDGLGIAREDVAAFGDQHNDTQLLAWAGVGVAVANASPEALAAADLVAPSNEQDGVAAVLEAWLERGAPDG